MVAFNDSEDLIVLSTDGKIFFVDVTTGKVNEQGKIPIMDNIDDAKFDEASNVLVFKTLMCEFFFVNNVTSVGAMSQPRS